jgi:hypothetical protein
MMDYIPTATEVYKAAHDATNLIKSSLLAADSVTAYHNGIWYNSTIPVNGRTCGPVSGDAIATSKSWAV